jgi:hypothetical protein
MLLFKRKNLPKVGPVHDENRVRSLIYIAIFTEREVTK